MTLPRNCPERPRKEHKRHVTRACACGEWPSKATIVKKHGLGPSKAYDADLPPNRCSRGSLGVDAPVRQSLRNARLTHAPRLHRRSPRPSSYTATATALGSGVSPPLSPRHELATDSGWSSSGPTLRPPVLLHDPTPSTTLTGARTCYGHDPASHKGPVSNQGRPTPRSRGAGPPIDLPSPRS